MSDVIMAAINRLEREVADVKVDVAQFRAGQDRLGERVANLEGVTSQLIEGMSNLWGEVRQLRESMERGDAQLREAMDRQGVELREAMEGGDAQLREAMEKQRAEFRGEISELRQEMRHTVRIILTSWISLAALILINILLAFLKGG